MITKVCCAVGAANLLRFKEIQVVKESSLKGQGSSNVNIQARTIGVKCCARCLHCLHCLHCL